MSCKKVYCCFLNKDARGVVDVEIQHGWCLEILPDVLRSRYNQEGLGFFNDILMSGKMLIWQF